MAEVKTPARTFKAPANVRCDCGHTRKDHYNGEGWCHSSTHANPGACGCTYYYPNVKWIAKQRKKAGLPPQS